MLGLRVSFTCLALLAVLEAQQVAPALALFHSHRHNSHRTSRQAAGVESLELPQTSQAIAQTACGLPTDYLQTSHCFADSTHHTCCLLGPEARAYADASGNPIGTAAEKAWMHLHGEKPAEDELLPWCTCFGSLVCSYYAAKFPNDGTQVKFINDPQAEEGEPVGAVDIPKSMDCEAKARDYMRVAAHGTPGVSMHASFGADSSKCPHFVPSEHMMDLKKFNDGSVEPIGRELHEM